MHPIRDHRDDGTPGLALVLALWATMALAVSVWAIVAHSMLIGVVAIVLVAALVWTAGTER